jgi:hypothetical protein
LRTKPKTNPACRIVKREILSLNSISTEDPNVHNNTNIPRAVVVTISAAANSLLSLALKSLTICVMRRIKKAYATGFVKGFGKKNSCDTANTPTPINITRVSKGKTRGFFM